MLKRMKVAAVVVAVAQKYQICTSHDHSSNLDLLAILFITAGAPVLIKNKDCSDLSHKGSREPYIRASGPKFLSGYRTLGASLDPKPKT